MTKTKHEALRRDIEDYKLLLIKYQSLRIEQDILLADMERQTKLLQAKNEKFLDTQKRVEYLESELNTLRVTIEKQSLKIAEQDRVYNNISRLYYIEKAKVYHMKKGQAKLRAWQVATIFFFFSMLVVGSQH